MLNSILKKALAVAMAALMLAAFSGCGDNNEPGAEPKNAQTDIKKDDVKSEDDNKKDEEALEKKEEAASGNAEAAPQINSAEELEGIVNEFNETDDPERKEELRKQLEAILSQAEAAAENN